MTSSSWALSRPSPNADVPVRREDVLRVLERGIRRDVPMAELLGKVSEIVGAPLGVVSAEGEEIAVGGPAQAPTVHALSTGERVWVGSASPELVELLLEQLPIVARTAFLRQAVPAAEHDRVGALLSGMPTERRRAVLAVLGLAHDQPVRVLALAGPADGVREVVERERRRGRVSCGRTGVLAALLMPDRPDIAELDIPIGVRIGMSATCPAEAAAAAWEEALVAIRFSQPSPRPRGPYRLEESVLLDADVVGGYGLFARDLNPERIAEVADVQALDRLVEVEGSDLLRTLDAVVATGSMRKAAERVHVHHNSVTQRVARVERGLGFEIRGPYGRNRLFMAVTLRRLRDSAALVAGAGDKWRAIDPSGG